MQESVFNGDKIKYVGIAILFTVASKLQKKILLNSSQDNIAREVISDNNIIQRSTNKQKDIDAV